MNRELQTRWLQMVSLSTHSTGSWGSQFLIRSGVLSIVIPTVLTGSAHLLEPSFHLCRILCIQCPVCFGCCNKVPQTGSLYVCTGAKCISHGSGGWKCKIKVLAQLHSSQGPLSGAWPAASPCLHMAIGAGVYVGSLLSEP